MRNLTPLLALFLLVQSSQAALGAEDYYVWIDENGVTNYAERNPQGYEAQYVTREHAFGRKILERPVAPAKKEGSATNNRPGSKPDPDALIADEAAAMAAEVAAVKRKNCEIGKNNLARLKAFARIRVSDEQGQNRILSDAEKEARMTKARQTISENCSG